VAEDTIRITAEFEDKLSAGSAQAEANVRRSMNGVSSSFKSAADSSRLLDAAYREIARIQGTTTDRLSADARKLAQTWAETWAKTGPPKSVTDKFRTFDDRVKDLGRNLSAFERQVDRLGQTKRGGVGGWLDKQFAPETLAKALPAALGLGTGLVAVTAINRGVQAVQDTIKKTSDAYITYQRQLRSAAEAQGVVADGLTPIVTQLDALNGRIETNDRKIGAVTSRLELWNTALKGAASEGLALTLQKMQEFNQFLDDHPILKGIVAGALGGAGNFSVLSGLLGKPNEFPTIAPAQGTGTFESPGEFKRRVISEETARRADDALRKKIIRDEFGPTEAETAKKSKEAADALKSFNDRLKEIIGLGGKSNLDQWVLLASPSIAENRRQQMAEEDARQAAKDAVRKRIAGQLGGIPQAPAAAIGPDQLMDQWAKDKHAADRAYAEALRKTEEYGRRWADMTAGILNDVILRGRPLADGIKSMFLGILEDILADATRRATQNFFTDLARRVFPSSDGSTMQSISPQVETATASFSPNITVSIPAERPRAMVGRVLIPAPSSVERNRLSVYLDDHIQTQVLPMLGGR